MIFTIVRRMYDCSRTTGETPLPSFRIPRFLTRLWSVWWIRKL